MFKEIRQINLTPTIALLLGLPIPYSNLGIPIEDLFEDELLLHAYKATYIQVNSISDWIFN